MWITGLWIVLVFCSVLLYHVFYGRNELPYVLRPASGGQVIGGYSEKERGDRFLYLLSAGAGSFLGTLIVFSFTLTSHWENSLFEVATAMAIFGWCGAIIGAKLFFKHRSATLYSIPI